MTTLGGRQSGPFVQHDGTVLDVGRQRLAVAVILAAVVVEIEPLDTDHLVERDPLAQVRPLVAVDRTDREVDLVLAQTAGSPCGAGRASSKGGGSIASISAQSWSMRARRSSLPASTQS